MTLLPAVKPCAEVVVIVTVEPDSVAPLGELAIVKVGLKLTPVGRPLVPKVKAWVEFSVLANWIRVLSPTKLFCVPGLARLLMSW